MIELAGVSKTYKTGRVSFRALNNVSLKIHEGEFVSIVGPSGSGKSTLLNILGFLDRADEGKYFLYGRDVTKLSDNALSSLRNRIAGFVFQKFFLLPRMTALDNVALPLIYSGGIKSYQRAKDKIALVNLSDREEHIPGELSGGEQQRIAVARSMVNDPAIVFADEPTGNLDSKNGAEIVNLLKELHRSGKTVILITHDLNMAKNAHRIITIRDGMIESDKKNRGKGKGDTGGDHLMPLESILSESHSAIGKAEIGDYFSQAIRSILSHKMRSLLSVLGILIGVSSVISMLAIGQGASASIKQDLSSLGSNRLVVRPGSMRQRHVALEAGTVTRFTLEDAKAMKRIIGVEGASPSVRGSGQVVYQNKNWRTAIQGVGIDYQKISISNPVTGRFFTRSDMRARKRYAVIGSTVSRELFGTENPIGKRIKINRISFVIIGMLPAMGASPFRDKDDIVVIPVTTAMYRVMGKKYVDNIDVGVTDIKDMDRVKEEVRKLVIKRHRLKGENIDSFYIRDLTEIRDALTSTTRTMGVLLAIVASISLLVGGIGIMNIMLVSVRERTREIGLRKAIGARKIDIQVQFLIESSLLTLTGGVLGIILGITIALVLQLLSGWAVIISIVSILVSTVFSVLVGIFFGFWPAIKASKLDPIDALRYE
jgi:macrolide transport system ATP-binding/permease protein